MNESSNATETAAGNITGTFDHAAQCVHNLDVALRAIKEGVLVIAPDINPTQRQEIARELWVMESHIPPAYAQIGRDPSPGTAWLQRDKETPAQH